MKGKNGISCFFSEETYSRFLGKETFETRLQQNLKKVGIHLLPLLHIEPDQTVPSRAETGADTKVENEIKSIDQSVAENSKSPRKRKSKKQSQRKVKSELANQNDLKPDLKAESANQDESKLKDESASQNDSNLEDKTFNQNSSNLDVTDVLKRAQEYASSQASKNVCDIDRIIKEKKEDDFGKESQSKSSRVKEHDEKYKGHETEFKEIERKSDDINESASEVTETVKPASEPDTENLHTKTEVVKEKQTTKTHATAPVKYSETDAKTVIPETEMHDAAHIEQDLERSKDEKEKTPSILIDDDKALLTAAKKNKTSPGPVLTQDLDKAKDNDRNEKSPIHSEGVKIDGKGNKRASESSSEEDEDSVSGYGKQRRPEREKNFQERKRNASHIKDRRRYLIP